MLTQQTIKAIVFSKLSTLGRRIFPRQLQVGTAAVLLTLGVAHNALAIPAQKPVFLSVSAKPHVNLIMSVNEELFKKAYNDYSNLDGGTMSMADTTYRNNFEYYGYFDPNWCYTYSGTPAAPVSGDYFTPSFAAGSAPIAAHKCAADNATAPTAWSGNFLNWATMARIDIIRRVLFGGKRSVDTVSQTILERTYLPKDIHSFVKVYAGTDLAALTPYVYNASTLPALSLCNVSTNTPASSGYPLVRVASGAWSQWSASEGQQCQYGSSATTTPASGLGNYTAKVEACVIGKEAATSARCEKYGSNYKPKGILQKFGEDGNLKFSLITGSYKGNLKGGVLRRAATPIAGNSPSSLDEINLTTGQFNASVNGIIKNINSFIIEGYSFSGNKYNDCNIHSIPVATVKAGTTDGKTCNDWGNPLAEIYLEALRYIAGKPTPVAAFNVDDTTASGSYVGVPGLTRASDSFGGTWGSDPWPADQWCAKCASIVLSTGANSFDGDDLTSVSDLPGMSVSALNTLTDTIGNNEATFPGSFFSGGTTVGQLYCQPTSLTKLSDFRGICPEQPAMEGTYAVAGLAYYARINDLRTGTSYPGKQNLSTYAVDLAESLPSFTVPVQGVPVSFLPACSAMPSGGNWQSCSLIDVKVESLTYSGSNLVSGSYLMFWEDSLWGNDYDFDGAQRIAFCVGSACSPAISANQVKIVNSVPYANAGNALQFTYNITGVGPAVTSNVISNQSAGTPTVTPNNLAGFAGGVMTPWAQRPGSQNFDRLKTPADNWPATVTRVESTFTASSTSGATLLKKPLYYAAKYGGFNEDFAASNKNNLPDQVAEWDNRNGTADGVPDNYFSVKNPAQLEDSLNTILSSIVGAIATASSVATNTTQLSGGAFVYQAQFNSDDWSGALYSYAFDNNGVLGTTPAHCTKNYVVGGVTQCTGVMPTSSSGRRIYTYNGSARVDFAWANLTTTQQNNLKVLGESTNTNAMNRVDWLLGNATNETTTGGLRVRGTGAARNILGDIVDSSPVFIGDWDYGYTRLSGSGSTYSAFVTAKKTKVANGGGVIMVGANDGMVHGFNSTTLEELFAYVPNSVFPKLPGITNPNYGGAGSPNPHTYTVDGSIAVGDVYIGGQWRTIVVGALGAGGRGIYALDVTDSYVTLPPAAAHAFVPPTVLFELTDADYPKLGYVMGKPLIVPMRNGRWAVVFGNGDSSGNNSSLFVVDIEAPLDSNRTRVLDAGAGTGLSSPELLPNAKGEAVAAYAGDLSGNVWKFKLDDTNPLNWAKAYLLFTATDSAGNAQPITATPTLGLNAAKGGVVMVYLGTGKYYDSTDSTASAVPVHSFYAIADTGSLVTRSSLKAKTISTTGTTSRTVNETNPNWSTQNGWYLDFSDTTGEKVTTKALLLEDKLIFPTLIPSSAACDHGGNSWLMEVVAVGDKHIGEHLLDHPTYNTFLVLGDIGYGLKSDSTGTIIGSGTDSTLINKDLTLHGNGRQSWRQLR